MIANGLDTIASHNVLDFLRKYFNKEQVDTVVIGYPVTLKNEPSEAIRYVNDFLRKFEQTFPEKRYFLMDERFTSKLASQAMIDGGLKKKQRQNKAIVDKISATIILQSYMQMKDNFPNFSK